MKKLNIYINEFNKNKKIKAKKYLFNYIIRNINSQSVIIIIYNENIFFTNDDI